MSRSRMFKYLKTKDNIEQYFLNFRAYIKLELVFWWLSIKLLKYCVWQITHPRIFWKLIVVYSIGLCMFSAQTHVRRPRAATIVHCLAPMHRTSFDTYNTFTFNIMLYIACILPFISQVYSFMNISVSVHSPMKCKRFWWQFRLKFWM